jgi:hypothetical protein
VNGATTRPPAVPRKLPPLILAFLNALLAVVATYAVLRGYDVLFKSEPNPATIIWSARIAMFWRLGVGIYVAGPAAIIAWLAASRNLPLTTRVTAALVPIVGALIAVQGGFLP